MGSGLTRNFHAVIFALAVLATACGGPTAPTPPTLKVLSVTPAAGSTTGGTAITISGTEFGADAVVTIGGIAATQVSVVGSTSITAVAPSRTTAGAADVTVSSGGKTAALTNGFTYVAPSSANQPPVITAIRSIGSRPNQPANFADVGETITLVATIADNETAVDQLTLEWSGPGTFSTQTPTTGWTIATDIAPTPSAVSVTLKATERFVEGGVTHMQSSAPFTYTLQVHNSQKEILDIGDDFLTLFSNSINSTTDVLHNFSKTCDGGRGYDDEKGDVDANRFYTQQNFAASRVTRLAATVNFRGACFPPGKPAQSNTDACASLRVHWEVTYIRDSPDGHKKGETSTAEGVDYVSAVVESNVWRLCHSSFVADKGFPTLGLH